MGLLYNTNDIEHRLHQKMWWQIIIKICMIAMKFKTYQN